MERILDKSLLKLSLTFGAFLMLALSPLYQVRAEGNERDKFISGRVQTLEKGLFLIRLASPSLIAEHYERNGVAAVGAELELCSELEQQILAEQQEIEERLLELSADIEVIYRYKYLMNALAVSAPLVYMEFISHFDAVQKVIADSHYFDPPDFTAEFLDFDFLSDIRAESEKDSWYTSVDHIRATYAHEAHGITGKGIKVGIIDSGIDYTHSMFLGPGDPLIFRQIGPNEANSYFPNEKVLGGIDLVGDVYNPRSYNGLNIPRVNPNPIDLGGHGTHVAGTVAGIGDGEKTYSGVAPDADLYAIKVFGAGSTSDIVVAQALEYSMDPDFTGDVADRLHVVNLSLGGGFGIPQGTYSEVLTNATRAGIVVVAAAGNSGPVPFVVGNPSATDDAISVAASIDGMEHNWLFPTVEFSFVVEGAEEFFSAKVIEANFTRPVSRSLDVKGKIVDAGLALTPFEGELAELLKGSIALIKRGEISFFDKIKHAFDAGAIGVIMMNNAPGDPIAMGGGTELINIPAIMITLDQGQKILDLLESDVDVVTNYRGRETIKTPEIIDTITSFSSYGPRFMDGILKPELAAPGYRIISAQAGAGDAGVALNGTSMASPHVAGVMALLVQRFPGKTPLELKDILLNSSQMMYRADDAPFDLPAQGAGLVNVEKAFNQQVIATPSIISLGYRNLNGDSKLVHKQVRLKFLDLEKLKLLSPTDLQVEIEKKQNLELVDFFFSTVDGDKEEVKFEFTLRLTSQSRNLDLLQMVLNFKHQELGLLARIPIFGLARAVVDADISGIAENIISFVSKGETEIYPFIHMGSDPKKPDYDYFGLPILSRDCDLREVYAKVTKTADRRALEVLQIAVLIDSPVTMWHTCDVTLLFDVNGDGENDLELVGTGIGSILGQQAGAMLPGRQRATFLVDAVEAREIRAQHEEKIRLAQANGQQEPDLSYASALIDLGDMRTFDHGRLAIIEIPTRALPVNEQGDISFELYLLNNYGGFISDDQWGTDSVTWNLDELREKSKGLPRSLTIGSSELDFEVKAPFAELHFIAPFNSPGTEVLVPAP